MRKEVSFGSKIRELRERRAWTQEHLAEVAGIESVRTVQRVENNETQKAETLQAIAAAFDVGVQDLRTERAIPEYRMIGTWLVSSYRQFVNVEEAHNWQMSCRSVLGPLENEEHRSVNDILKRVFSDRECISRLDPELWDCYLEQVQEPLESLFGLGMVLFILGERRDLMLPTLGDLRPLRDHIPDWTVQHLMVVPKHGCFRLGPGGELHRFNESCEAASDALFRAVKQKIGAEVYENALWAAMDPRVGNTVRWCDICFPLVSGGSRITFEYIEQVTGLSRYQLHALCDAITGLPFIDGLA
jgi:transcriptional regulator with XRE-family HTH domain